MLSLILLFIAGISKAVMDTLNFHYDLSIFENFKKQNWWNPAISWMNKYKDGDISKGEKFPGSTTVFVWLTDAWHFFQHIMIFSLILSIVLYLPFTPFLLLDFVILYITFTGTFELFYSKIFLRK